MNGGTCSFRRITCSCRRPCARATNMTHACLARECNIVEPHNALPPPTAVWRNIIITPHQAPQLCLCADAARRVEAPERAQLRRGDHEVTRIPPWAVLKQPFKARPLPLRAHPRRHCARYRRDGGGGGGGPCTRSACPHEVAPTTICGHVRGVQRWTSHCAAAPTHTTLHACTPQTHIAHFDGEWLRLWRGAGN
jgi:hypothetical protein